MTCGCTLFSLVVKMFSRNGFSLTFLLVSVCVLFLMAPATRAECDCDKPENEQQERNGFDNILHKTLCGVKGAARTVTNKVKDGYHYVKTKLSSSDSKQPEETTYPDIDLRFGNTEKPVNLAN